MSEEAVQVRTYGNWRIPRRAGLGKLSFAESLIVLAGLAVVSIVAMVKGVMMAAGVGLVWAGGVFLMTSRDVHGVSVLERMGQRMRFRTAARRKSNIHATGGLALEPTHGKCHLPGMLYASKLSEHRDSYERPFALVEHGDGTRSVVMSVSPEGGGLTDQDTVDHQVALWGMWLGDLGGQMGVAQASVCLETIPDSGDRLRREVNSRMSEDAPGVAKDVLQRVVADYGQGAARVRAWITVTFDPAKMGTSARKRDQVVSRIASDLPGLTQTLMGTGAGGVHLLTAREVTQLTRVAFDPASEVLFEQAANVGDTVALAWQDCGPIRAEAGWDSYRHDSAVSRSWVMSRPARGYVQSGVLRKILEPSRDVERKRVTIIYRPLDAAKAPAAADADVNRAAARVENSARPTATARRELLAAQQVADEEASGAGLVDFAMVISATTRGDDLDDTSSAVTALASSSRLLVRVAYGAQDSAFALGLPLGLRPVSQSLTGGW
ncbi:MAG: hypothetical protein Q4D87_01435 [Actinomycetaceae bacterium]|nr:hypothetical protein [Actinomycetaceae bacterium]